MELGDGDGFGELLRDQEGVVSTAAVLRYLTPAALRWRLTSGRWQQPCRGVVVAQSGPLSATQRLWVALLWGGGEGASVAGLTAARLDGLHGFDEPAVHLLVPADRKVRREPISRWIRMPVVVHRSRRLGGSDIHPVRLPPRTLLPRSLVDAAAWSTTDDRARAVLAAGVQQRRADMSRDNDFTVTGYRVLRFPAFAIRTDPDRVAQQIMTALRLPATTEPAVRPRVTASRSDRPSESRAGGPGERPVVRWPP